MAHKDMNVEVDLVINDDFEKELIRLEKAVNDFLAMSADDRWEKYSKSTLEKIRGEK